MLHRLSCLYYTPGIQKQGLHQTPNKVEILTKTISLYLLSEAVQAAKTPLTTEQLGKKLQVI